TYHTASQLHNLLRQRDDVVPLAVEYQPKRTVLVGHWLMTGIGKVHDGQPSMPKPNGVLHVATAIVRTTMEHRIAHCRQLALVDACAVKSHNGDNSAHCSGSPQAAPTASAAPITVATATSGRAEGRRDRHR